MLRMTDFSTLMQILEPLRLQRFSIEKKLHGTTSQLLLQKMVKYFTLFIIEQDVTGTWRCILRFSWAQEGFYHFYLLCQDLAECPECVMCSFLLSNAVNKSYTIYFTLIQAQWWKIGIADHFVFIFESKYSIHLLILRLVLSYAYALLKPSWSQKKGILYAIVRKEKKNIVIEYFYQYNSPPQASLNLQKTYRKIIILGISTGRSELSLRIE